MALLARSSPYAAARNAEQSPSLLFDSCLDLALALLIAAHLIYARCKVSRRSGESASRRVAALRNESDDQFAHSNTQSRNIEPKLET